MSNMGYCRFRNSFSDLLDCEDFLDIKLSEEEHNARIRLIELCKRIVDECYDEEGKPFGDWNKSYEEMLEDCPGCGAKVPEEDINWDDETCIECEGDEE